MNLSYQKGNVVPVSLLIDEQKERMIYTREDTLLSGITQFTLLTIYQKLPPLMLKSTIYKT